MVAEGGVAVVKRNIVPKIRPCAVPASDVFRVHIAAVRPVAVACRHPTHFIFEYSERSRSILSIRSFTLHSIFSLTEFLSINMADIESSPISYEDLASIEDAFEEIDTEIS